MKPLLFLCLFILGCASRKEHRPLFPFGIYHHRVELAMKGKQMSFRGVNLWSRDKLNLLALGDFDVTLLSYQEDFKSGHKQVFVNDLLPITREQAKKYLSVVRSLYSLDTSICTGPVCKTSFYGQEFVMNLDEKGEVSTILLERKGISVRVNRESYEGFRSGVTDDQKGKKLNH